MRNKTARRAAFGAFLLLSLTLVSCVPIPQNGVQPSREIGTVRATGPAAFLNGRAVRDGERLFNGHRLSTGANSSIKATFNGGGFVQLRENTDPTFRQFFEAAKCVIRVALQFGEVFAESSNTCAIETETPNASVTLHSGVNIRVVGGRTEVTVLRGSATLAAFPNLRVTRGEQITVANSRIVSRRRLNARQLRAVAGWRGRYRFPRLLRMPNLRRLPLRQARERLRAMELRIGTVSQRAARRQPSGTVLEQRPRPGANVRPGTVVSLVVEARSVQVPRITGRPLARAQRQLRETGFQIGGIERRITGRARVNTVLQQRPPPGARVAPGTRVTLVVEARSVAVPRVTGRLLRDASSRLRARGLIAGKIDRRVTRRARVNTVLQQQPKPGSRVAPGSKVNLIVEGRQPIIRQPEIRQPERRQPDIR